MNGIVGLLRLTSFLAFAFVLTLLPQGLWAAALAANLRTGISVPWSAPVAVIGIFICWRWAGGQWPWPNSEQARMHRRAHAISFPALVWALIANAFSLGSLAALWVTLHQMFPFPARSAPDFSPYPLGVTFAILGAAALVGALSEEVGFRGYIQGRLEGIVPWPLAIVLMALIASPAHAFTQGFAWTTMLFYFLTDAAFGLTARLTNSILPGIVAHAAGLFVFFLLIWPHDQARSPPPFASTEFRVEIGAFLVFGALAIWAFLRLARTSRNPIVSKNRAAKV